MILDLLRQRRSIRKYQPTPIEPEKVELLEEALLRAPSSRDLNPWEFVFVTDPELLKAIAGAKPHGAGFVAGAPLAVVIAADPAKCDVWVEDCSIAAILLQLAAESLGLGSCWVQIRLRPHAGGGTAEAYLRGLLGLPDHLVVEAVVALGYPAQAKPGHPRESLPRGRVHRNRYGAP